MTETEAERNSLPTFGSVQAKIRKGVDDYYDRWNELLEPRLNHMQLAGVSSDEMMRRIENDDPFLCLHDCEEEISRAALAKFVVKRLDLNDIKAAAAYWLGERFGDDEAAAQKYMETTNINDVFSTAIVDQVNVVLKLKEIVLAAA